ncbi:unnamed protein product [Phaedon cochleariae]|uniref:DNA ligase 4 n=1 Tax=Phaedon cochleariae TaxID=80249 RepID=A0A9P0GTA8_PHACE|nr:unnamed protein product [Phaedon cochleariae]
MMNFKELCSIFDELKQIKGQNDKFKYLRDKFQQIRHDLQNNPTDFFQIFRLFLPKLDRERDSYHMKEAKVARTLIKMLDLPAGNDKNVLSKSYLMAGQATDFGDVVYSVIRKYLSNHKTTLTVQEVNKSLDDLTKRKGESEAEEIMMKMFKKASPEHTRWIIRIILKDLKLGISTNSILNCYHRDGGSFYSSNNNLRKVCEVLADENVRLHELEIEIFDAFRPMLSKKIDVSNFKKELPENKTFFIENKFDGERFQLHMKNNVFRYLSRNGFDYTDQMGKTYDTGIFTPKLKALFNKTVKSVILDGELMLWHKHSKKFGSKGMTYDVKKLSEKDPYQPCFCIYDIIFLNDKVHTNTPLRERVEMLKTVFRTEKPGTLVLSVVKEVNSRQEIIDELNLSLKKEEEGIIVKDPDSIYKYSDRNSGWYKMKLEYFQDVMNDLDLIVMGAKYESSTSVKLNSFTVGIRSGIASNGKPLYLSFGKVSSGLNDEQLAMLNNKIKTQGKNFENFDSVNLNFGKDTPNWYIEPQHSLVFQVRASELIRHTDNSFKTPFTLRFPRVLQIREDKPVDECLNINELLELTKSNKFVIKLNKRGIDLEEILTVKKRKTTKQAPQMPTFYDTKQVSDILEGYNVYVLSGTQKCDKEKAESLIKQAGGKVMYRPKEQVDIILASERSEKVRQLAQKRPRYDIVSLSWLERVLQDGNLLGYDQSEVFYLGWNYKNSLSNELDKYGDSFLEETTIEKLKVTFELVSDSGDYSNLGQLVRLEGRKYFNKYTAYFDKFVIPDDLDSGIAYHSYIDELEFQYYGGTVCERILENVNLIVFDGDSKRKKLLEKYLKSKGRDDIVILSKSFIYEE